MLYLATASTPPVREAMRAGLLGQMATHVSRNAIEPNVPWAMDNGCFADTWTPGPWLDYLQQLAPLPGCLFAVVPDVVCEAAATDDRWAEWAPVVRSLGYRPAYVTQNGCERIPEDAGAVFTGGDDAWKLGPDAQRLVRGAKAVGLWCHMGRVNSLRRLRIAEADGYDSVDGTFIAKAPNKNLPLMLRYLERAHEPRLPFHPTGPIGC